MISGGESEEELDPRVQGELESLNHATNEINKLENEMSLERAKFKQLLNGAIQQLTFCGKKLEKSIERARPYYETIKEVKQAQAALERAVQNFQKSNGIYRAAKETIALAEQRLSEFNDPKVDGAWQEMLNLQTMRFMEAERDRTRSEQIHKRAALRYEYLQKKASKQKQKHKNSTAKTEYYYETKETLEAELQKQQQRVTDLQGTIKSAKSRYQEALSNLEKISLEIHQQRKLSKLKLDLPERDEVEGSETPDSDNLTSMAKLANIDLKRSRVYDNVDQLEVELDKFDFEDCSSEEEEESSDEEWSESSGSSGKLTTGYFSTEPRRSTLPDVLSHTHNCPINEPLGVGGSRKRKKIIRHKSTPSRQGSILKDVVETADQFVTSQGHTTSKINKRCSSNDVTYDTLHGINASSLDSAEEEGPREEYDIFEDLC